MVKTTIIPYKYYIYPAVDLMIDKTVAEFYIFKLIFVSNYFPLSIISYKLEIYVLQMDINWKLGKAHNTLRP